ncbi:MAG: hypothetical protein ABR968_04500 [Bacteroidales bacterium]|jgi:hypothetical protein
MPCATSVILPNDILKFILRAFNRKGIRSRRTGCSAYIHDFTKDINRFVEENAEPFPDLDSKFHDGLSECTVKRALNKKTPHGATRDLRNLFALYATDGELEWNQFIKTHFPCHIALLEQEEATGEQPAHNATLNDIYKQNLLIIQLLNDIKQSFINGIK